MYKRGQIDFDDLNNSKKTYSAKIAYEQAALAIVLASQEFCRRFSGIIHRADVSLTSHLVQVRVSPPFVLILASLERKSLVIRSTIPFSVA